MGLRWTVRTTCLALIVERKQKIDIDASFADDSASVDMVGLRGIRRSSQYDDLHPVSEKRGSIKVDSDCEGSNTGNNLSYMVEVTILASQIISSSESDSDSDADNSINASSKRRLEKKIWRIIDDAELGEETKKKIAIEKQRQDWLNLWSCGFLSNLLSQFLHWITEVHMMALATSIPYEISAGHIVNVVKVKRQLRFLNKIENQPGLAWPKVLLTRKSEGWGLRALEEIPQGPSFLTNIELYASSTKRSSKDKRVYPVLLDADWTTEEI